MFTFRFTFWGRGGGCAADALGGGDAILAYSYVFIFRLGAGLKMRRGLLSFFGDRCRWWFTFRFSFFYGLLAGRFAVLPWPFNWTTRFDAEYSCLVWGLCLMVGCARAIVVSGGCTVLEERCP